jgi:uncharacterized membrane-anchored protein YhcB (DUF1043 family)
MNIFVIIIIVLVLGVVVGNILLLKHSAKLSMKNVNQDPIEQARKRLEDRINSKDKPKND